jgi:2-aminoadipate transaminase
MPGGGMFFWVELPEGVDSEALLVKAVARGVAFVPGAPFFAAAPRANTLRLSFVTVGAEVIERGIAALAAALRDLQEETAGAHGTKRAAQRAGVAR